MGSRGAGEPRSRGAQERGSPGAGEPRRKRSCVPSEYENKTAAGPLCRWAPLPLGPPAPMLLKTGKLDAHQLNSY